MIAYGINVVAGVTPGKGGHTWNDSVPIYNTMQEAVDAMGATIENESHEEILNENEEPITSTIESNSESDSTENPDIVQSSV